MLGPRVFMPPALEMEVEQVALWGVIQDSTQNDLPQEHTDKLPDIEFGFHLDAFWRARGKEP